MRSVVVDTIQAALKYRDDKSHENEWELVERINALNAAANCSGLGRCDLPHSILADANLIVERQGPLLWITGKVVQTFNDICSFLTEVNDARRLEWIDPQLGRNTKMVKLLHSWEEAWMIGRNQHGLLDTVDFMIDVDNGSLKEMDHDVTAMLTVPRLLLMRCVAQPAYEDALLQLCDSEDLDLQIDPLREMLAGMDVEELYGMAFGDTLLQEPKGFWHSLEAKSQRLQRHRPKGWNNFLYVLSRSIVPPSAVDQLI